LPWEREGDEIVREWRFEDFVAAVAFVNRVAKTAEDANHHAHTAAAQEAWPGSPPRPMNAWEARRYRRGLLLPLGASLNERRRPTSK
jgi:predicted RNA polymerase sigma factor